jgi:ATP-dependent HslUV protease subunit HslV
MWRLRTSGFGLAALQPQRRSTTILSVRKGNTVVLIGDRQVTQGQSIVAKSSAKKLRRAGENVMCGFAGSTADALTLLEKLEGKLNEYPNQLTRACVELAKEWRSDKALRRLEASLIVCDKDETLEIDGTGNVMTPEADGIVAIGSGGTYAKAAARALIDIEGLGAEEIARKAMKIATDIDVFSNGNWDVDKIEIPAAPAVEGSAPTTPAEGTTASTSTSGSTSTGTSSSSTTVSASKDKGYTYSMHV